MQKPWFGHGDDPDADMDDPILRGEIDLMADLMVAAADHQGLMPAAELVRALCLGAITSPRCNHDRGRAVMAAVNAQNRLAPAAREATERLPSTASLYRTLAAISRGGGGQTASDDLAPTPG